MSKPISLKKYFVALSKDSLVYGLGNVVLKLLAIVTAPILTRLFIPAQYGVLSLIASIISFLSLFMMFGMDTSVFLRVNEFKNEKKTVVSSGFWFLVTWGVFLSGICILFSRQIATAAFHNPSTAIYFTLAFSTAFFTLLINYVKTIYRLEFKAKTFALTTAIGAVIITSLSIGLIHVWGLFGYFFGTLIGTIITFLITIYLIRENFQFSWKWAHAKDMAIVGMMLVPASLSYFVFDLSDRFFINHYWNLNLLGLYAMAINVTSVLPFFSMALSRAWLPMIFNLHSEEKEVFDEFVPRIFVYYLAFFMILAVGISFFGLEILKVLTVSKYYAAASAIGPLSLAMVFSATVQITSVGIYLTKKTKKIAICSGLAAIINTVCNFLLIPKFGIIGASWATALSYFFLTGAYLWYSQRLVYIKINWTKVSKIIIMGLLVVILMPLTWKYSFGLNFIIKIVEMLVFLGLLPLIGVIEPSEINTIKKLFTGQFNKKHPSDEEEDVEAENSPVLD
ncbi:MAG: flippase [Candidatus Berkelbacteria bacterium]